MSYLIITSMENKHYPLMKIFGLFPVHVKRVTEIMYSLLLHI